MPDSCREVRPKHLKAAERWSESGAGLWPEGTGGNQLPLPPCRDYMSEFDMDGHRRPVEHVVEDANRGAARKKSIKA